MSIGTMVIELRFFKKKKKKKEKKKGKGIIFPFGVFLLRYLVHNFVFMYLVL